MAATAGLIVATGEIVATAIVAAPAIASSIIINSLDKKNNELANKREVEKK